MPRKARIDAPGALQHIIVRGIARKRVFYGDNGGDNFIASLTAILLESTARRFAWAFIPKIICTCYFTTPRFPFTLLCGGCSTDVHLRLITAIVGTDCCFKIVTNPFYI